MKPTQEQVIAWAEEAGVHEGGKYNWVAGNRWETALALAYEAGRADENEACAKVVDDGRFLHDDSPEAKFGKACAAAIRARREQ